MDSEIKNYEIAYLLSPSIEEAEVLTYTGQISSIIENEKGLIKYAENPSKRRLSYPVKKNKDAFFGWITFSASPNAAKIIGKKTSELATVLREQVVIKETPDARIKPLRFIKTPSAQTSEKSFPGQDIPEEKLDLEALDKKLEEILGN